MSGFTLKKWLIAAVLLLPCAADAAGLGRLTVLSALGQPFNAEIELIAVQKEDLTSLSARLASPDAYQQANLQYAPALIGLRISIEKRASGEPLIKVTSLRPVNDPFLDLLIELNWSSGRLVREFTALLDPPGLAPAPVVTAAPMAVAPTRPAPIAPVATGTYGPIQRGETLSGIARSLMPEGVTLEQMLVGLFRSNPEAFIRKNMNLVRSGKILRVPERSEIAAVSQAEAVKEYRAQVADWKAYRARLADTPAAAREAGPAASGRITTRIDDKAATEAKDVVRLSKGEAPGPGMAGVGAKGSAADRIRSLEEEVAARDKALKEANERVAQLEKTIKDMQRLAEIKSAGMAVAQQQAQAKSDAKPEPATPDTQAAVKVEDRATPKPVPEKAEEKPTPKAVVVDKPKPKPEMKKAPPPPPAPSLTDTLFENPVYLGGGAVIVLGALGYWLMRRRRREETVDEPVAVVRTAASPVATAETAATKPAAVAETVAELDPMDEASVYITHGRHAQAEAILTEAIAKNPGREALQVKLLEVYALRKDKSAFGKRAEEFRKLTGGAGDNWLKVAAMGAALDPGNTLYGVAKDAAVPTPELPEAATADLDFNLETPDTGTATQTIAQAPVTPDIDLEVPASEPRSAAPAASEGGALDFEIEVPKLDVPSSSSAPQTAAKPESAPGLDFKLDLGALDLSLDERKPGTAETVPAAAGHDAHWHDVQAKFDLVKAYQEMGDKAGAMDILKEVLQEGDAEQQAKAKNLLDGLG